MRLNIKRLILLTMATFVTLTPTVLAQSNLPITQNENVILNQKDNQNMLSINTSVDYLTNQEHKKIRLITTDTQELVKAKKSILVVNEKSDTTQKTDIQPKPTENENIVETKKEPTIKSRTIYSFKYFMVAGVIKWSGYKFTYYSQRVLPGGGLKIPRRHVNSDGYVVDKDGYIVLANNKPIGTIIDTPFGAKGKVYDRGTSGNHFDVYVK